MIGLGPAVMRSGLRMSSKPLGKLIDTSNENMQFPPVQNVSHWEKQSIFFFYQLDNSAILDLKARCNRDNYTFMMDVSDSKVHFLY